LGDWLRRIGQNGFKNRAYWDWGVKIFGGLPIWQARPVKTIGFPRLRPEGY